MLSDHPRDLCLLTLGINTAYRAGELLSLTVRQVRHCEPGDYLDLKQRKTKKYRPVSLNTPAIESIQRYIQQGDRQDDDPLFMGKRGPLTVSTVSSLVKTWCQNAGLKGNYGSHTLRKPGVTGNAWNAARLFRC